MSKQIIVTGGCGGLGNELVRAHLTQGDHVTAIDLKITPEITSLMEQYRNLSFLPCDISSTPDVMNAIADSFLSAERIDILYHTVGIYRFQDKVYLPETDLDSIGSMFNINAVGFLRVLKALWTKFHQTAIICITSEAGSIGNNFRSWEYGYCMSKCAENMAAAIAQHHFDELGNGSRIMCLHPGWLRTKMGGKDAFLNTEQSVAPEDSAGCIKEIAESINTFPKEIMYMDYKQTPLKW